MLLPARCEPFHWEDVGWSVDGLDVAVLSALFVKIYGVKSAIN